MERVRAPAPPDIHPHGLPGLVPAGCGCRASCRPGADAGPDRRGAARPVLLPSPPPIPPRRVRSTAPAATRLPVAHAGPRTVPGPRFLRGRFWHAGTFAHGGGQDLQIGSRADADRRRYDRTDCGPGAQESGTHLCVGYAGRLQMPGLRHRRFPKHGTGSGTAPDRLTAAAGLPGRTCRRPAAHIRRVAGQP